MSTSRSALVALALLMVAGTAPAAVTLYSYNWEGPDAQWGYATNDALVATVATPGTPTGGAGTKVGRMTNTTADRFLNAFDYGLDYALPAGTVTLTTSFIDGLAQPKAGNEYIRVILGFENTVGGSESYSTVYIHAFTATSDQAFSTFTQTTNIAAQVAGGVAYLKYVQISYYNEGPVPAGDRTAFIDNFLATVEVPEPASLSLLTLGGLALLKRQRKP